MIKKQILENLNFIIKSTLFNILVHTIGVLFNVNQSQNKWFDDSIYENTNFETAKRVADLVNKHSSVHKKKMIYISASTHPPGFSGYLKTKWKAEEYIQNLPNLDFHSLRCGLITSEERKFLRPLGNLLNFIRESQLKTPLKKLFEETRPGDFMKNFESPAMIELDDVANAALYLHLNQGKIDQKILEVEAIQTLSEKFKLDF